MNSLTLCGFLLVSICTLVFSGPEEWGNDTADEYLHDLIMDSAGMDTVFVPLDTYLTSGTLHLEGLHDLCIWFEPGTEVLLDNVYRSILKLSNCNDIVVMNAYLHHIEPLEYDDCHGAVIVLANSSCITVDNCTVKGCGSIGFLINECQDILIRHCLIEDNSNSAFCLLSYDDLKVTSCHIRNNGRLILSQGIGNQNNLDMLNNLIHDNRSIWIYDPDTDDLATPGLR